MGLSVSEEGDAKDEIMARRLLRGLCNCGVCTHVHATVYCTCTHVRSPRGCAVCLCVHMCVRVAVWCVCTCMFVWLCGVCKCACARVHARGCVVCVHVGLCGTRDKEKIETE